MSANRHWTALKIATASVYLFLLIPIVGVVVVSFSPSQLPSFPPEGFSLMWYGEFVSDNRMLKALFNSLVVATGSTLLAGVIGLLSAMGFVRRSFRGKHVFSSVLYLPMLISPVVIGVAITAYLTQLGMEKSYVYLILGHSTLVLPYVFVTVRAQLYGFDESLEEAARTLGANDFETFFEVTFPLIRPGLLAGMLLGFVISFGEFTATQFWVTPDTETAPIIIYSMVRTSLTPKINALATVLILVTVVLPLVLSRLTGTNFLIRATK